MRKLKFLSIAVMGVLAFVSCKPTEVPQPVNILEDGMYIVGEATATTNLEVDNAALGLMAAGINENGGAVRPGMYEKYIALEANKPFSFTLKAGDLVSNYSATLSEVDLTDGTGQSVSDQPAITVYRGNLIENGTMTVPASGLYHVIVDLNDDDALSAKTVIVAPVNWGVRGAMNSWGFTAFDAPTFSKTKMVYTMTNVDIETAGQFKFAYGGGWKILLDEAGNIRVNTNLGNNATSDGEELMPNDLLPGGKNFAIGRGYFTITLTWDLGSGAIKTNYSASLAKTGDKEVLDPATFIYSLIGSAIYNGETQSNWDYDQDFTYVSKSGNDYLFEAANVRLGVGEFKMRFNHDWGKNFGYGDMVYNGITTLSDNGGNIANSTEATFSKIQFRFSWDGSAEVNKELTFVP